jgi:drug/metabolite transporter (DMT)-like permease
VNNRHPQLSLTNWILLLILSLIWGGSFLFIGVAVSGLPPLTIVLLRVGLAAIILNIFVRVTGLSIPAKREAWSAFILLGLLNNVIPFSLIVWGQTHIASGLAAILNSTVPLFGVILAHFLTADEKMNWSRFTGILVGFTGVIVIIGPGLLLSIGTDLLAQLAVLTAALSYAMAGIYAKRFKRMNINPVVTATGHVTASAVFMIPLVLIVDRPWELAMPGIEVISAVIALAVFSTALAYVLYFRVIASAGATNALLVTFLFPVSASILGAVFLDEVITLGHVIGMSIISVGLAILDGRPVQWLQRVTNVSRPVAVPVCCDSESKFEELRR